MLLHLRNLLPRSGNALFLLGHHHHHHVNNWKSSYQLEKTIRFVHNNQKRQKKIHSSLPSIDQLVNARVIYSVAPSMGHNQVSFNFLKLLLVAVGSNPRNHIIAIVI
ncbi:hypothetical protein QL285_072172 [Trifolium repens]|nr:hypothetical protein QL285_072172 [Trifolium repens]